MSPWKPLKTQENGFSVLKRKDHPHTLIKMARNKLTLVALSCLWTLPQWVWWAQ